MTIYRRFKIAALAGTVAVPAVVECLPFVWPVDQTEAAATGNAKAHLEQMLNANGFPGGFKLEDVHTDLDLLSFQGPALKVSGTTDLIIVPENAIEDLGLHICVLFQLKRPAVLNNGTKEHVFRATSIELIAGRAVSAQKSILQIVTNLNDISSGFRLEEKIDGNVRSFVRRRYDFNSLGQMAAFVVAHLQDCTGGDGYRLSDQAPGDASELSLKRKFNPEIEAAEFMEELEDIQEDPDLKYRVLRTRDVLRSRLGVELSDLSMGSLLQKYV